ncbi:MAG: molybdate ABC transporter substrate-binding protein [Solirubrobacterales bacterium]|nr:molybdate ABC transporter substrate-binding protein [Solirubrobacterales bacterium]
MRRGAGTAPLLLAVAALAFGGCGGDDDGGSGDRDLLVSAATSLKSAFTVYAERFDAANVQLSFAGSDELAAQIRQGARPDVYAAANTKLPGALLAEGLVERPRAFTANTLVLVVPAGARGDGGDGVRSLDDLTREGVTIAIGAGSVPIGAYTRTVLDRLGAARRAAILANVRSTEPDVGGIAAKLTQGAVDAGFLYATDVVASGGRLRAIELPARLRPRAAYAVAVVKGAEHRAAARAFVAGLLDGAGERALREAGFRSPR